VVKIQKEKFLNQSCRLHRLYNFIVSFLLNTSIHILALQAADHRYQTDGKWTGKIFQLHPAYCVYVFFLSRFDSFYHIGSVSCYRYIHDYSMVYFRALEQ